MKNTENSQIFQILRFCSILGVCQGNLRQLGGVFGLSRSVLEASWGILEASWTHLGGILDASWGILDVSWGKYRKNVEGALFFGRVLRAKMEAKIIKIRIKNTTCFYWRF